MLEFVTIIVGATLFGRTLSEPDIPFATSEPSYNTDMVLEYLDHIVGNASLPGKSKYDEHHLAPNTRWDHDSYELEHLKPSLSVNLFFSQHDDNKRAQQIGHGSYELALPGVVLEHSGFVTNVTCPTPDSMILTIDDQVAFDYVKIHWAPFSKETERTMLLIGYFEGCGSDFDKNHRSWSVVHDFEYMEIGKIHRVHFIVEHVKRISVVKNGIYKFDHQSAISSTEVKALRETKRMRKRETNPDKLRHAWDWVKDKVSDVGDWFKDKSSKVREWFKEKLKWVKGPHTWTVDPHTLAFNWTEILNETTTWGRPGRQFLFSNMYTQIFCLECFAVGRASFSGSVVWNQSGIIGGKVDFDGAFNSTIRLGIDSTNYLDIPWSFKGPKWDDWNRLKYEKLLYHLPLTPLHVPGEFTFGPMININFGAYIQLLTQGQLEIGIKMDFPNPKFTLDLADFHKSTSSGWRGKVRPIFKAGATIEPRIAVMTPVEFLVGVNIMSEGSVENAWHKWSKLNFSKTKMGVGIREQPLVKLYAKDHFELKSIQQYRPDDNLSDDWEIGGPGVPQACGGLQLGLAVHFDTVVFADLSPKNNHFWRSLYKILKHIDLVTQELCLPHDPIHRLAPPVIVVAPNKTSSTISPLLSSSQATTSLNFPGPGETTVPPSITATHKSLRRSKTKTRTSTHTVGPKTKPLKVVHGPRPLH